MCPYGGKDPRRTHGTKKQKPRQPAGSPNPFEPASQSSLWRCPIFRSRLGAFGLGFVLLFDHLFQCARALIRSELWNPARHVDPKSLPTPGQILAALSDDKVGGEPYDREWPERAAKTLW